MMTLKNFALICLVASLPMSASANSKQAKPSPNLSPEFIAYGLNLYNYVVNNSCYMDDINTRDSSLKQSGKIIYWFNGGKREIVDAMVFRLPTNKGIKTIYELNGQVSGTYLCIKGQNFQSRYMFEDRLLRKLDRHTQDRIKNALKKQGKYK